MVNQEDNDKIIGISKHIADIREQIEIAAKSDLSVLIQGPSGTGKELITKSILNQSNRKNKPFEVVNCGAIPSELFESELFGHKKGSFTGAILDKQGKVAIADGGTLFLDEIGDLRTDHQVKILRFLEDGKYTPVGETTEKEVKVRIIAATNKDLLKEIKNGVFREDLYYRLNEYCIHTLPLAKRPEDVVYLVNHYSTRSKLTEEDFKIRLLLYTYQFAGNVRELKNAFSAYDYTTIVNKIWRSVSSRVGKDANLSPGLDPDDYRSYSVICLYDTKLPGSPLTIEERNQKDYDNFKRALKFIEKYSHVVKKCVRAFEIITLWQRTQLSKEDIAEILKIRRNTLSPSRFKLTYGFEFPDRNKPFPIDSPIEMVKGV